MRSKSALAFVPTLGRMALLLSAFSVIFGCSSSNSDQGQQAPPSAAPALVPRYPTGVLAGAGDVSSIKGVFPDYSPDGVCCFVGREARFRVHSDSDARSVRFELYVPTYDPWKSNPGTISILDSSGKVSAVQSLTAGSQVVTLPLPRSSVVAGIASVHIRLSHAYVPKTVGIDNDPRLLSAILRSVTTN